MFTSELWTLLLICLAPHIFAATGSERFSELLTLKPLRDGRVASHFSFVISQNSQSPWNDGGEDEGELPYAVQSQRLREPTRPAQHHSLFPLTLGQLLREYAVTEMHLTLNAGKWDYGRWGMPEDPAVASGAELWAWMSDSEDTRQV